MVQETSHESRGLVFHNNLRNGFLENAKSASRYNVLNADKTIEELHDDIVKLVDERLLDA